VRIADSQKEAGHLPLLEAPCINPKKPNENYLKKMLKQREFAGRKCCLFTKSAAKVYILLE